MADRRQLLREMAERRTNFDVADLPEVTTDPWHVDDYCRPLPGEAPGAPVPGGPFEVARRLMTDYEFADPSMVRAYYDAEAPLLGRDMLLEIRFFVIRYFVGVRISQLWDETRTVDGREAYVWGWAYQTLEGHLERGQMDYQLWKWADTGEVEYRIHAVSELLENVGNPFVRIGFRVLGRREQVLFARRCGERMDRLVRAELERGERAHRTPDVDEGVKVSPSSPG